MAQVKLYRGSQEASLPVTTQDGALYVVQTGAETGDVYADINGQRIKIGTGSGGTFIHTTAEWQQLSELVSARGSIYIYSDARSYQDGEETVYVPGIKVGDGTSYVVDLPFVNVTAEQINF